MEMEGKHGTPSVNIEIKI